MYCSFLDNILGPPIYIFLSLFAKDRNHINKKTPILLAKNKKILIIKLFEMGSSVACAPLVQALQEKFSKEKIYFLVFQEHKEILLTMDLIDKNNIFEINIKNPLSFIISLTKVLIAANKMKFSDSISLEFSNYIGPILSFLMRAKRSSGFYNPHDKILNYKNGLYDFPCSYNASGHIYDIYSNIFRKTFSIDGANHFFSEFKKKLHKSSLNQNLPFKRSKKNKLILFNINLFDELPLRKWPQEYYFILSEMLLKMDRSLVIVFTGAMKNYGNFNHLFNKELIEKKILSRCINYIGKTSTLLELIKLIESSDLFLTTDSGPGHFASLSNTETLVLFGPETPKLFKPLGDNVTSVFLNLACSPCFSLASGRVSKCQNNICLKGITPDAIYKMIKEKIYA